MSAANHDTHQRWSRPPRIALGRFHLPYPVIVIVLGALVTAEQVLELRLSAELARPNATRQAITFVIMLVYFLLSMHLLRRKALGALLDLRAAVLISDEEYDRHARSMVEPRVGVELALLAAAAGIGVPLIVMDRELVNLVARQAGAWALLGLISLTVGADGVVIVIVALHEYQASTRSRTPGALPVGR